MKTNTEPADEAMVPIVHRHGWLAPLFFVAGFGLVPWTLYLFVTLPSRHLQAGYYDLAWGGFDLVLASLFVATGAGLLGSRLWVQSTATATATMLFCDAWFDVLSAGPGDERLFAIVLAVTAELPTAVVCLMIARHVEEAAERAQRYALLARRLRARSRTVLPDTADAG